MSDKQFEEDIQTLDKACEWHLTADQEAAWQRIRARLTPDRERVARAIEESCAVAELDETFWLKAADAAIDAMKETP